MFDRSAWKKKWYAANREQVLAHRKRYYRANRERILGRERLRRGLPLAERPEPDTCECCGGPPTGKGSLHLDHDAVSGKFRGWLCSKCNQALGLLGDNLSGVLDAVAYLERA